MRFIEGKNRSCPCGCGNSCKLIYAHGRFKDYSKKAPNCPNKYKRRFKQRMPDRLPVGSKRIDLVRGVPYYIIKIPGKAQWMREHRYIAQTQIRSLLPGEHVHHINGDTLDNRVENLSILSHGEHTKLHHKLEGRWSIRHDACLTCGKTNYKHIARGYCNSCYQKAYHRQCAFSIRATSVI
jgi:hypothetical protein